MSFARFNSNGHTVIVRLNDLNANKNLRQQYGFLNITKYLNSSIALFSLIFSTFVRMLLSYGWPVRQFMVCGNERVPIKLFESKYLC